MDDDESIDLSDEEDKDLDEVHLEMMRKRASLRTMRRQTKTLALGDALDRHIHSVLTKICSSSLTAHVFEQENKADHVSTEAREKYEEALVIEMVTYLPIIKLAKDKYLIGTRQRVLQLKGSGCQVRTAKTPQIDDYLMEHAREECERLSKKVVKGDGTMKTAVVRLLRDLKVDEKVVKKTEKKYTPEFDQEFSYLMTRL